MTETISGPEHFYALLVPGTLSALAALMLRRAEAAIPDPHDIEARDGLMHMLIGVTAWTAIAAFLTMALAWLGLIPALLFTAFILVARRLNPGARLIRFYRLQLTLAAAGLLAAMILWLNALSSMRGLLHA